MGSHVVRRFVLGLFALAIFAASPVAAQSSSEDDDWKFTLAPYLLAPHMNGNVAIGSIAADVDVGPGDIFSRLKFGAMLYIEMANQNWAVSFDGLYMNLGETGQTPINQREVTVSMKQGAFQASALRRVASWAEVGLGARLNILDAGLVIAPGTVLPGSDVVETNTWFDPLIVTRVTLPLEGRWRIGVLGDIGGFGVGSKFAWQIYPKVGYRFSSLFELAAAYRILGMDYETGSGETLFVYDMRIFGPELALVFHF